jgi:predicted RND superfamily exporter protein
MLSNFAKFYQDNILSRPKFVCLLVIFTAIFFASQIAHFRLDASSDSLVLENDQSLAFYRQIRDEYGSDELLIMTFSPFEPLFKQKTLEKLAQLGQQLGHISGLSTVTNILTVPLLNSPPVTLASLQQQTPTLLSPTTDVRLAQQELVNSPLYRNLLISTDSKTTALLLYISKDKKKPAKTTLKNEIAVAGLAPSSPLNQANPAPLLQQKSPPNAKIKAQQQQGQLIANIREVMAKFSPYGDLHLGGIPMITADSIDFIRHDLTNFGLVVILFIILMLAIAFSRLSWVVLPLITCFISATMMVGFLGLVDWPVTIVSSNFVSLMLILTLSLLIHLIVRYQEYHWQQPDASQFTLISATLRKKFVPCLFTTLTTIVAFGSLMASDIRPVIEFGWMMTISVILSFVMVFTLFPAMVMLLKPGKAVNQQNITKRLMHSIASALLPRQGYIFATYSIIVGLSIFGISLLTVENRFIDYFKKSTEIYQGMVLIDQKLGGTTPLDVIINAPQEILFVEQQDQDPTQGELGQDEDMLDDDLLAELDMDEEDFADFIDDAAEQANNGYWFNPTMLEQVAEYHQFLTDYKHTGKVLSLASSMALINQLEPATKTDNFVLSVLYKKLPESIKEVLIAPYLSQDGNQIRFSIRVYESDKSLNRSQLLSDIKQQMQEKFNLAPEQVQLTGMLVLYNNVLQSLFQSQIFTLATVFLGILLMFILLFRNLKLALITLIPNLVAASMVLGLMGWLNIPLDIMTITVAAICVGIAVDNSIHYVHRFKLEYNQAHDYQIAMLNSHASIGRAIYYTSITITLGFSILALSNFIPSIYFGLLTGFSMVIALVANLTLLPLLLVRLKPFKNKAQQLS